MTRYLIAAAISLGLLAACQPVDLTNPFLPEDVHDHCVTYTPDRDWCWVSDDIYPTIVDHPTVPVYPTTGA